MAAVHHHALKLYNEEHTNNLKAKLSGDARLTLILELRVL